MQTSVATADERRHCRRCLTPAEQFRVSEDNSSATSHILSLPQHSQQRAGNLNTEKGKVLKTLNYIRVAPDSYGSPYGRTYSKKALNYRQHSWCDVHVNESLKNVVMFMSMSHLRTV